MKNTYQTKNNGMSEESKELIKEFKKTRQKNVKKKKKQYPIWVYFTGKDKVTPHVSVPKLGAFLLNKHQNNWLIVQDKDKNEFWVYKSKKITPNKSTKVWQLDNIKNIKGFIHEELNKYGLWSAKSETDTYKYIVGALQLRIRPKEETIDHEKDNLVPFLNGVFDVKHMKLLSNDIKYYFTDCSPYEMPEKPKNEATLTNKWFNETFKENATTIKEYIGYMFFNTYASFQAFMFLVGEGGDGKSTITNYIASLLPSTWVTNMSLEALTKGEKSSTNFNTAELKGIYLNLNQDITNDSIQDSSKIKSLTGWDWINAQKKGKQEQVRFRNHAKLLFACNSLPKSFDISKGMERRLYIIPTHKILDFNDKYDMNKINAERGAFARECIQLYLDRYNHEIKNHVEIPQLTLTPSILDNRKKWIVDNSVVRQWIEEQVIPQNELDKLNWPEQKKNRGTKETFEAFINWGKASNVKYMPSKNEFNKQLEKAGYKRRRMHFSKNDNIYRWENLALFQDSGNVPQI